MVGKVKPFITKEGFFGELHEVWNGTEYVYHYELVYWEPSFEFATKHCSICTKGADGLTNKYHKGARLW